MRSVLLTLLFLLPGAATASNRFAPDNPWFQDFEAACRVNDTMAGECMGSVVGAFAAYAGADPDDVTCDFEAFWRTKDDSKDSRMFDVLPWQYGVEFIVEAEGVCHVEATAPAQ